MAVAPQNYDLDNEVRMLVVGKTGAGKSTTCNAILGFSAFQALSSLSSVTSRSEFETSERFGKTLVVLDTPGVKDTTIQEEEVIREITGWYSLMAPGIHAVLLVLKGDRFTKEEEDTIDFFTNIFGDNLKNYLIVVFANKDQLEDSQISLTTFIETAKSSSNLRKLINEIGGRCISIGHYKGGKRDREAEVQELLSMIDTLRVQNGNNYFSNAEFVRAETIIQEEHQRMLSDRIFANINFPLIRNQIRRAIFNRKTIFFALLAGLGLAFNLRR